MVIDKDVYFPAEDTFLFLDSIQLDDTIKLVIEIGGGSGIISIFLAKNNPNVRFLVTDISSDAAFTIKENSKLNNVKNQIDVICMDKLEAIRQIESEIIIWNPPYLPNDTESDKLRTKEKLMLIGGHKGYEKAYNFMRYLKQNKEKATFYTIFSSIGWKPEMISKLENENILLEIIDEINIFFETLYLTKIRFSEKNDEK